MFSEVFKRFWKEKLAWNVLRNQLRDFKDQEERNIRKLQLLRDYIHTTFMKIVQFSRPPHPPLSTYVQNLSTPLTLDVQFQKNPFPPVSSETSLSAFSWLYTLVCAVVQKYHKMSFSFTITHICSTHLAINLFYLHNLKAYTNYRKATAPCM